MLISVIIPLYNKRPHVAATLQSLFAQTHSDFELVIVDDGSTDGSADEVRRCLAGIPHTQAVNIITQPNAGVSAARNTGIQAATADYIALLDADDEWTPDYLATQADLATRYPQCQVFALSYLFRYHDGTTTPATIRHLPFNTPHGVLTNYFEVAAHSHPPICSISIMVTKTALTSIGGFPLGIKSGEDLLTWARLATRYQIAYSRKQCAIFNVEGYKTSEKPKRVPAENDIVGQELLALQREYHTPGLRQYRAMWHKMRASVYMRLRMRRKSLRECAKSLRCTPLNHKVWAFALLNLLPTPLQPF